MGITSPMNYASNQRLMTIRNYNKCSLYAPIRTGQPGPPMRRIPEPHQDARRLTGDREGIPSHTRTPIPGNAAKPAPAKAFFLPVRGPAPATPPRTPARGRVDSRISFSWFFGDLGTRLHREG